MLERISFHRLLLAGHWCCNIISPSSDEHLYDSSPGCWGATWRDWTQVGRSLPAFNSNSFSLQNPQRNDFVIFQTATTCLPGFSFNWAALATTLIIIIGITHHLATTLIIIIGITPHLATTLIIIIGITRHLATTLMKQEFLIGIMSSCFVVCEDKSHLWK